MSTQVWPLSSARLSISDRTSIGTRSIETGCAGHEDNVDLTSASSIICLSKPQVFFPKRYWIHRLDVWTTTTGWFFFFFCSVAVDCQSVWFCCLFDYRYQICRRVHTLLQWHAVSVVLCVFWTVRWMFGFRLSFCGRSSYDPLWQKGDKVTGRKPPWGFVPKTLSVSETLISSSSKLHWGRSCTVTLRPWRRRRPSCEPLAYI